MYKCIPVYNSMYVLNNFTPDDLLREFVFFNTFDSRLRGAEVAHHGTNGGLGGGEAVRIIPNTVSVRGSRGEHGGQSPPYAVISGWKCNSYDPSPVQQAQGIRFPLGLR